MEHALMENIFDSLISVGFKTTPPKMNLRHFFGLMNYSSQETKRSWSKLELVAQKKAHCCNSS